MPTHALSFDAPEDPTTSLTDQVKRSVRAAIASGNMKPGELYSIYQLADAFNVSRSPVRDAMVRLEEAGLVRFERNRGFRILQSRPEDVAEIFAMRIALEVPSARRAALVIASGESLITVPDDGFSAEGGATIQLADALRNEINQMQAASEEGDEDGFFHHDQRFHDLIMHAARNNHLRDSVNRMRVSTRILGSSTAGVDRTLATIAHEHDPIFTAICAGEAEAAAAAMRTHLATTGRLLVKQAVNKQGLDLDGEQIWAQMTVGY
ncbi:GntR family transcriptional regulator [Klugiella xanthotipulae]|uniref:GntR family transcriptional regulator n=1 Tax=Klugiella xanthotipulae TaxID=244735 RepID=A0A543I788_9MICO|nr:GntR family transcriptional regulator [Klugiella xanthotipulae]TQM66360.1 GntR family transcriptional regulator [Klugiella xanthotipulae]